jgi:hypothetical protein
MAASADDAEGAGMDHGVRKLAHWIAIYRRAHGSAASAPRENKVTGGTP